MKDCMRKRYTGIKLMLEAIYFQKKENMNIRIKSVKRQVIMVYDKGQWVMRNRNEVFRGMIGKVVIIMGKCLKQCELILTDEEAIDIQKCLSDVSDKSNHKMYEIRRYIQALLEMNRENDTAIVDTMDLNKRENDTVVSLENMKIT